MSIFIVSGRMNGGESKTTRLLAYNKAHAETIAMLSGYAKVTNITRSAK